METPDTNLAAALITNGVPVRKMHKDSWRRVHFHFEDNERLQDLIRKFWAKELYVDAQTVLTELKTLKHRISDLT